ncbi:MAG: hypothetical protein HUJ22_09880 [Gracilimonas sp.]|uniref:hypothetical protein n=1 Tax=Gracilimonas sp. TaxID=1974203 RepID=UPI0019CEAF9C|nr:hypothetical protein [Gracilimonas sp.]MBD3616870.1 hypothetical protein [Gracilimonas sp.]
MKEVYIHIGYPKCLSTTIQRSFFEKHPGINFAGVGVEDNISYRNKDIEYGFEVLLKYASNVFWENHKKKFKDVVVNFVEESGAKKPVFSSEHLSMNFSFQGIENLIKYERLNEVFSNYTIKILVIHRDPISFIRSLYKEYLKMGYKESYSDYLRWILTFQDRNFLPDLNYELKINSLSGFFGRQNITSLSFESIIERGVETELKQSLTNWLKLNSKDCDNLNIGNENPSLSQEEAAKLLIYNKKNPRGMGLAQTEPFERHRSRLQYRYSGLDYSEKEIFSNVVDKRKALEGIKSMTKPKDVNFQDSNALEEEILNTIASFGS